MENALQGIGDLLRQAAQEDPPFPPTLLFEEGWMLRLVLQWFSGSEVADHDLSFQPGARWFSEALLGSTFLSRYRGDKFAEGYTHADGVIGHFQIGKTNQAELSLDPDATQFVVVEAKMFNGLSKGTTRAPAYNQAARNVACMAELIRRSDRDPSIISDKAFFVVAPAQQIDGGVFSSLMDVSALGKVVGQRVADYDSSKKDWFEQWFLPTLHSMRVDCLSWENIIDFVETVDVSFGKDLASFYNRCLEYNLASRSVGKDRG